MRAFFSGIRTCPVARGPGEKLCTSESLFTGDREPVTTMYHAVA